MSTFVRRSMYWRPRPVVVVPGGTVADPTQLLTATSTQTENGSAYNALGVPSLAVGGTYTDPTSSIEVTRLTNASFPATNTLCVPPYWEGGAIISYPWGDNEEMRTVLILARGGGDTRLVDWNTSTNAVTNSRTAPGSAGELNCGFSLDPATPQQLITLSGGNLLTYNTATGALVETIRTGLANSGIPWLTIGKMNRRITWQVSSTGTVYSYDRDTDTVISRTFADLDEVKFDKVRYAWVRGEGRSFVWDVQANTLTTGAADGSGGNPGYMGHGGVVPGYAFGCGNNGSPDGVWYCDLAASATAGTVQLTQSSIVSCCEINSCGLWVDQDPAPTMWGVVAGNQNVCSFSGQRYNDAIGLYRLNGSEFRLVCHHYNTGSANEGGYYGAYGWPNISPDGKVLLFVSNMNGQSRTDVFGVKLPVSAT